MSTVQWPDLPADVIHERVAERWDFSTGWPLPRFTILCPVCGSDEVGLKDFRFFTRKGRSISRRCDVHAKCTVCSLVLSFGVPVTEEIFQRKQSGRVYRWRQVRDEVEASHVR